MSLVKVKEKYQVTLPTEIRQKAGLAVGDLLEVEIEGTKITLTPKSVVDREVALALEDYDKGRSIGPFRTAKTAVRALRRTAK
ncbi:MAG: AbrB/MazE/SpoVT family DNA-binding domain-containing protein [Candidatus Latescibacteria bacterium]|nr:AbrB/MazE/SpoVT family DNA-binding domain-containing protein [Candidatus Latescibacterota bacterium]